MKVKDLILALQRVPQEEVVRVSLDPLEENPFSRYFGNINAVEHGSGDVIIQVWEGKRNDQ